MAEEFLPPLDAGSEHLVYFDTAQSDVIKITRVGIYGDYYEVIGGLIDEFKCTPTE